MKLSGTFFDWLNRRSKISLVAGAFSLVLLVGLIDFFTPVAMSHMLFYLIPILFVTWYVGRGAGVGLAITTTITWSIVELLQHTPKEPGLITYWNALGRLGVFLVVVFLLHAIKSVNERLEEGIEKRTSELAAEVMERQRVEGLLRTNEEIFQQLTAAIREVFWMTSLDKSQVIYVSPAYETIWGRTCESNYASPKSWLDAIHPEDREGVVKAAMTTQVDGKYDYEYRIVQPNGSIRWIHDRAFPVRDTYGKVYRIAGLAQDITERKQAEAQLTTLAHAVESTSELISITDLEDRFVFVNQAFQKVHGYTEAEVLGKTPEILYSPRNPPNLSAEVLKQTHLGGWRGEVLDLRKDGTEFPISLSTSRIMNESGEVIGLMGVGRDITERTSDQEALRESEQRFRTAFGAAPVAMTIVSADGRFLQVNRTLCEMLGYTEKELLAKNISDITHPGDRDTTNWYVGRLLKGQSGFSQIEKRYLHKQGHVVWGRTTASLIRDKDQQPLYFIAHIQDFTERRRLEREILEISDREQARIGQDLHDGLCQQLVSTAFASNRLSHTLATNAPAEASTAKEIAGWLDEAISQARALARGLYPVKLEADGLVSALQELAEYVEDRFGIACVLENPSTALLVDNAVATHLYRIAQEAVTNAVKHSQAGRILIKLTSKQGAISVSVQDDGVGISDAATNGMGLHIMQYRTRMIGGSLKIERNPDGGTIVICSFQQEGSKTEGTGEM